MKEKDYWYSKGVTDLLEAVYTYSFLRKTTSFDVISEKGMIWLKCQKHIKPCQYGIVLHSTRPPAASVLLLCAGFYKG